MSHAFCDEAFLFAFRVVDFQFEDEAVDLCFGERIGPLLFNGVLGGEHEKRFRHSECLPGNGRLFFLHTFEQGALNLCGGAVDLVGKHDVGENGSLFHGEAVFGGIVNIGADHVCGQQVRRELDACECPVETLGESFDREGLCQSGETFEQNVAIGEHCGDQPVNKDALSGDDPAHFRFQRTDERRGFHDISLQFL